MGADAAAEQPVINLDERRKAENSDPRTVGYVARIGLCMLGDRIVKDDRKEGLLSIISALKGDPRIEDLAELDIEKVSLTRPTFAAAGIDSTIRPDFYSGSPISATIHHHVLEINPPLQFTVRMPRRVQVPKDGSYKEESVPSDIYWVTWDGIVLVVLWRCEGDRPYGAVGGIAVIDLLKEIAKKSGRSVYVQRCCTTCDYPFAHRDVQVVIDTEPDKERPWFTEVDRRRVELRISGKPKTPYDAASVLYRRASLISLWYARMRSDGQAITDTEQAARKDLSKLLTIYHDGTIIGSRANPRSWRARWNRRNWRRDVNKLITRLWLALSVMEARRHDWAISKNAYDNAAAYQGRALLFLYEYKDAVNDVSATEISSIESAVEYAASHLDSRSLIAATASGAVAGAIIGAIVAGAIQLGSSAAPNQVNPAPMPSPTISVRSVESAAG